MTEAVQAKLDYIQALEEKVKLQKGLPHLYGWKLYDWADEFIKSNNRYNFIVAGNQLGKSSTQIRKCIKWATEPEGWGRWPTPPNQFWYFYPTMGLCDAEVEEKWIKEFLPRGEFKNHPQYGWELIKKQRLPYCLKFNTGITVYFKSYEMDPMALQASSLHAMFCDEELPEYLFSELNMRMSSASVQGHFHMVFTATIGQSIWRDTMEGTGDQEMFKGAFKKCVSLYDCLTYKDGTKSPWTKRIIKNIEASCKSEAEIQKRVYGKFVVDDDLTYPGFVRSRHIKPSHPLPKEWMVFAGVDIGSGGLKGHPAAIVFVGVSPDFKQGRVFLGWRGDGIETTSGDVLQRFQLLKARMKPVAQYYDWHNKDFFTIASRIGEPFQQAEKGHEIGEHIVNTLFKNDMLMVYDTDELRKLIQELENLRKSTPKNKAKDDFIDALRYAVAKIPWDFTDMGIKHELKAVEDKRNKREVFYKEGFPEENPDGLDLLEAEFDEANEAYDYYD